MKNFNLKTVADIYVVEFKRKLKSLIIWCVGLLAVTMLYMLLQPFVKDMFMEKMEALPVELMELFGMSDSAAFANFNTYFASMSAIITVIISAYTLSLSAGIFRQEEETGTIEFSYAVAVSRQELWTAKVLAVVTNVAAITTTYMLAVLLSGAIVAADELNAGAIVLASMLILLTALVFAALGFFLACALKRNFNPSMIGIAVLFSVYLLGYLSAIGPSSVAFLKYTSPFSFLSTGEFMTSSAGVGREAYGVAGVVIAMLLVPCLTAASFFFYRKRDF